MVVSIPQNIVTDQHLFFQSILILFHNGKRFFIFIGTIGVKAYLLFIKSYITIRKFQYLIQYDFYDIHNLFNTEGIKFLEVL